MPPRRLLLYSDAPVSSGAERYLAQLAKGLPQDRYQVTVACNETGALDTFAGDLHRQGIEVRRLPAIHTLSDRGPFVKVSRFFVRNRFDVLHFNLCDPRSCNGAMTAARLGLRGQFVTTEHLPLSPFDEGKLPFRHRLALQNTAFTIVNSEAYRRAIESRPGYSGKVVVISNGIEDLGAVTRPKRVEARKRLQLPESGRVIGWLGRVTEQKNPGLLIDIIRKTLPRRRDITFAIIGDGDQLPRLQKAFKDHDERHRVRFYGHRSDAIKVLPAIDLLLNTSDYEGMPFSILEAAVQGIPCVAGSIPGMAELVGPGVSGWIAEARNATAYSNALVSALQHPPRLVAYSTAARQRALTLFSLPEVCRRTMSDVYDLI